MELWNHTRRHPLLPVGAVIAGWAAWFGLELASVYIVFMPVGHLIDRLPADYELIARQVAGVLFGAPRLLAVSIGVGWIVGRLHRPRQIAAALIFLATYLASEAPWVWRLVMDMLRDPRYGSSLFTEGFAILVSAGGVVLGAMWSAPAESPLALRGAQDERL
jgi:hypothetical protein